ncbi:hypothetical protein [Comamonas sp. JUb58]|uniref:hypothetical protein n=1 Tax=Comamonas sp. JUb58 TaxID=2485114 RepID=UPI00105CAC57|nr:hypothetical protein [Comamonas sp. JUb58]TDS71117.1 hypothetical protein EDF71_12533 [Comamonas sp. JUb58]
MSLREHWQEINAEDWQGASLGSTVVVGLAALYVLAQHLWTAEQWVFLLDHANLAIHEAGHPIVGIFSDRLAVYGGTLFQLLFPLLFVQHFWRQRQSLGFAAAWLWLGASLLNVARYMKDARSQQLPLVGGGEHDWTEIFSRWNLLASDTRIAGFVSLIGVSICVLAVVWLWFRGRSDG